MENSPFFKPSSEILIHRRRLPHWQQSKVLTFVTWRLADSLPQLLLRPWQVQRDTWLSAHPQPWSDAVQKAYYDRFGKEIDGWLDAGHGSCMLREPPFRDAIVSVLQHGDPQNYELVSYVVMPNHLHVLLIPKSTTSLPSILRSWKGVSSRRINQLRGTTGTLWHDEYWDRLIRGPKHLTRTLRYIANNPIRARLDSDSYTLWMREAEG